MQGEAARLVWVVLLLSACASTPAPIPTPETSAEPIAEPTVADAAPALVLRLLDSSGLSSDQPMTVVGPEGRCATPDQERCHGWVSLEGVHAATFIATERISAPALDASAPYVGRFVGSTIGFRIESDEGDALCPGSPTRITFTAGETELGRVEVPAPVVREEGSGVLGLILLEERRWVVLGWGRGARRIATIAGETVTEAEIDPTEDCDCCD